jgi:hypothetical protein
MDTPRRRAAYEVVLDSAAAATLNQPKSTPSPLAPQRRGSDRSSPAEIGSPDRTPDLMPVRLYGCLTAGAPYGGWCAVTFLQAMSYCEVA